jgi:hypothetical protein
MAQGESWKTPSCNAIAKPAIKPPISNRQDRVVALNISKKLSERPE